MYPRQAYHTMHLTLRNNKPAYFSIVSEHAEITELFHEVISN